MTQLSFFSSVQTFAKPFVKAAAVAADPLTAAKLRFVKVADESVKLITEGKDKGFWFRKLGAGYTVQLKNGAAVLKDCSFAVGNAKDAVKLLEKAKAACTAGEFDELFKATARAPRKPKDASEPSPVSAPAPTTPAPAAPAVVRAKRK